MKESNEIGAGLSWPFFLILSSIISCLNLDRVSQQPHFDIFGQMLLCGPVVLSVVGC